MVQSILVLLGALAFVGLVGVPIVWYSDRVKIRNKEQWEQLKATYPDAVAQGRLKPPYWM